MVIQQKESPMDTHSFQFVLKTLQVDIFFQLHIYSFHGIRHHKNKSPVEKLLYELNASTRETSPYSYENIFIKVINREKHFTLEMVYFGWPTLNLPWSLVNGAPFQCIAF